MFKEGESNGNDQKVSQNAHHGRVTKLNVQHT
jgi:hypothetical protein